MLTVIVSLLLFMLQKLIHELGHFIVARRAGIIVEEVGVGYGPQAAKIWQGKETLYTLNWFPFGGFIKMLGEKDSSAPGSFASKSKLTRFSVLIIGPLLSLIMLGIFLLPGIMCFTLAHLSGVPEPIMGSNLKGEEAPMAKTVITEVVEGAPASQKGIQVDDIVLGADEVEFNYIGDMVTYIERTKGTEITLHLDRKGQKLDIPIIPRANPPENQGALGVGINYEAETEIVPYPLPIALAKGVESTVKYIGLTLYLPVAIFRETLPAEATQPADPAEVNRQLASAASDAITANQWFQIFWLLGVLYTANLIPLALVTIISLLPFPGWDSWRILSLIFGK